MTGLDFTATGSAAVRQYGQWLHHKGHTQTWQAYDPMILGQYCADLRIDQATYDEIERVMADPSFVTEDADR